MILLEAHIELYVICSILLLILFGANVKYWRPRYINQLSLIYIFTLINCVLGIGAYLVDGHVEYIVLNYALNAVYFADIIVISLLWFRYCFKMLAPELWKKTAFRVITLIPAIAQIAIALLSVKTKMIFGVDSDALYYRGDYFLLQHWSTLYLAASSLMGLKSFIGADTMEERNKAMAVSLLAIPPLILGMAQALLPAGVLTTMEFAIFMSLLAYYIFSQDNRITSDPLTKLNNRLSMDSELKEKIKNYRANRQRLFLMMLDLDNFKQINDTYGHLEGDRALVRVANMLAEVGKKYDSLAVRFGGDEFAMIVESGSDKTVEEIVSEIDKEMRELSRGERYKLSMSCGCAEYREGVSLHDFMDEADKKLYIRKNEK